jgi:hypothetical protein
LHILKTNTAITYTRTISWQGSDSPHHGFPSKDDQTGSRINEQEKGHAAQLLYLKLFCTAKIIGDISLNDVKK